MKHSTKMLVRAGCSLVALLAVVWAASFALSVTPNDDWKEPAIGVTAAVLVTLCVLITGGFIIAAGAVAQVEVENEKGEA
jgi:protein-S-isoprenylcysteine O-methyltransferase Ste14